MSLRDSLMAYLWGKEVSREVGKHADVILECPAIKELIESLRNLTIDRGYGDVVVDTLRTNYEDLGGRGPSRLADSFERIIERGKAALEGEPSPPAIDTEKHPYRGNISREPQTTIEEDMIAVLIGEGNEISKE